MQRSRINDEAHQTGVRPRGISDGIFRGYHLFIWAYTYLVFGAFIDSNVVPSGTPQPSISEYFQQLIADTQHVDFSEEENAWGYLAMIYTARELAKEWGAFHLECDTFIPTDAPHRTEILARLRLARSEMTKTLDTTYKEGLAQWCRTSPLSRRPAEPIHSFALMAVLTEPR